MRWTTESADGEKKRKGQWSPMFAWFPVFIGYGDGTYRYAWLEKVLRRQEKVRRGLRAVWRSEYTLPEEHVQ